MSGSFIGSKIAIVTKSQCRYTGTIIGIDAQTSSILLGNVKCFGTENRGGNFFNNQMVGTVVPIMQFANSDIEDLKIVDEEAPPVGESTAKPQPSYPMPTVPSPPVATPKQASIHDDPAIVSAVVSSANKDLPNSNRLIHDLQHLNLSEDQSSKFRKPEESRLRNDSGELGPSWSLLSPSKWDDHKPQSQQSNARSKFFDDFKQNDSEQAPSGRPQQRWPSNTHSTQTSRQQEHRFNGHDDDSGLPVRQPFFSNDRSHPHDMPLQPPNRYQNGHMHHQQRPSYHNNNNNNNNQHNRRPPVMNYQQRRPGGGNRETFQDNGNNYDNEFDFESSNRKFNKISSEDEFKQQSESPHQFLRSHDHVDPSGDFEPMYDKKKSFFDSVALEDNADGSGPVYNRSRNHDTFGNDRSNRQRGGRGGGGGGGGYRRSNNQNYRQQQGNEDFYYRPNNNGYQYRH